MTRASRKLEHLRIALSSKLGKQTFSDVHFVHQALPEGSLDNTAIVASFGGLLLSSPIIINAMTGGAFETQKINEDLAVVARETGLAIAVGSQMSAVKNKDYIKTYQVVRKINNQGTVFANIGAEASVDQAKAAIEMVEANALQIHLNVIQELIMPEGERCFTGALDRIQAIKEAINVPLIIKEVGFGISREAATKLTARGITIIDVGGKGGTNFAEIENKRRVPSIAFYTDWGINTPQSILEVNSVPRTEIIATGGIRNGLDIAKAIGLGAQATGMAGAILRTLVEKNVDGAIKYIENVHHELKLVMTSLGAKKLLDLQKKPMVICNDVRDWCEQRGIPIAEIARR